MPTRPGTTSPTRLVPDHLALLLDGWGVSLAASNKRPTTISSYRRCALNMIAFFADKGMPQTATGVKREHVEAFIADLFERVSAATAAKHYRSLQQFFKWLDEDGEIENNPMAKMSPPKVPDNPPDVIPDDHVRQLLATCKGNTFENRRDAALISFLVETGCRVGEVVGMELSDYDATYKAVTVTGKGERIRGVGTTPALIEALRRYLRFRAAHPFADKTAAFWLGRKGPLTVSGVAQILNRRCDEAGIPHIHPHQFRHTFAHNWLRAGHQETDLMNAAGWRSRDMVGRYGRSAASERAQEATRNHSTLARLNTK